MVNQYVAATYNTRYAKTKEKFIIIVLNQKLIIQQNLEK